MLTLRGLTFDAAAPRIIVPLFARSLGALRPLAAAADADPAAEVVELSRAGLARRALKNAAGQDETRFLTPLHGILERGQSLAQVLEARYRDTWNGKVEPVMTEMAL